MHSKKYSWCRLPFYGIIFKGKTRQIKLVHSIASRRLEAKSVEAKYCDTRYFKILRNQQYWLPRDVLCLSWLVFACRCYLYNRSQAVLSLGISVLLFALCTFSLRLSIFAPSPHCLVELSELPGAIISDVCTCFSVISYQSSRTLRYTSQS